MNEYGGCPGMVSVAVTVTKSRLRIGWDRDVKACYQKLTSRGLG